MTDSGTGSSSKLLRESMSFAQPLHTSPHTPHDTLGSKSAMLSVNFPTPLAGVARNERIRQLTHNHLAFKRTRIAQEILVKAQHALRRMPGVSGQDASELVSHLQEVGQIINQETTQLVDALVNVTLDQEDTDKAIARMSIDANLAQARTDDQAQTIKDLRAELKRAEDEAKQALERLQISGGGINKGADKVTREREEHVSPDGLVKSLTESLRQMDRRLLSGAPSWAEEQQQARAADVKQGAQQKTLADAAASTPVDGGNDRGRAMLADASSSSGPKRVSSFQPLGRTSAATPPKFGPLQPGPPRAPAAMSHDRRGHGTWAGQGRPCSTGANGPLTTNNSSAFGSAPRKGGFQPLPRYRPNGGAEYHHQHALDGGRPASSYGHRRDIYPSTPTSAGRNRYGGPVPGTPGSAMSFGPAMGGRSGPPIHLTERAIAAWNEQVMEFYAAIRSFVRRHASEPQHDTMTASRSSLWPALLAMHHPLSDPEAASYLGYHLRNENSKACVVTRVIIDYVVSRVWVPAAWIGSDSKTSYELVDLTRELEAAQGQPSSARQPLLNDLASIIASIVKSEQGTVWHKHKVEEIARALHTTVQPLLNKFATPADASLDMEHVAELAWDLSSKMLRSRLTFDFRFPDIGARFSPQSMLPIWPVVDPADLQAKHWRVAFVTTPAITCRNDTGPSISAHSVSLADVLCMQ